MLSDLAAWSGTGNGASLMYWRAVTGADVDFVIEWKKKLLPVEVKATTQPRTADVKHLTVFRNEYQKSSLPALLLHCGNEVFWIADGILAAPWWKVI